MPVRLCSITCVTEFSTVSADAPGYVAEIVTDGGATFGYCSMGSEVIANTPAIIVIIASTHANTGLSIKKRAILLKFLVCYREPRDEGCHSDGLTLAPGFTF